MEGSKAALTPVPGIGVQAKDWKVGDVLKLVVHGYGGINQYFDGMVLNPHDRLIEVSVTSVKKVKEQEFIDA